MEDYCCNKCNRLHRLAVQPQLYDVATTCRLLSISRSSFYQLVKDGRISVCKLGNKTLISSYSIRDFVQAVDGNDIAGGSP
jgi:excisionase family DNA binding protein